MLRKGGQNLLTRMRVVESACASGPSSTLGGGIQNAVSSVDGCVLSHIMTIYVLLWAEHVRFWVDTTELSARCSRFFTLAYSTLLWIRMDRFLIFFFIILL